MSQSITLTAESAAETAQIAKIIAEFCRPGDVVLLDGDLGTGKTHFVKALVEGLGSTDLVTSPTFSIANFYTAPAGSVLHIDAYRLSGITEFRELGLADYFPDAVVLIEWAERIISDFDTYLKILIKYPPDKNNSREFLIEYAGNRWAASFPEIQGKLALI